MKPYLVFTKKEFLGNLRTFKLLIMGTVFLVLGLMNPFIAKYTPVLLEALAPEFTAGFPEPTALDSWMQFFSNVGQMGLLALMIVFSGSLASELRRGTLINLLTKGLGRGTVILSKFTAATVIWTGSYLLSLGVSAGFTAYFWGLDGLHNAFMAFAGLWLFGVLLISLLMLGGVLFRRMYGALLFAGGFIVITSLVSIIPTARRYNPITMAGENVALLNGSIDPSDIWPAALLCIGLTAAVLYASKAIFDRSHAI